MFWGSQNDSTCSLKTYISKIEVWLFYPPPFGKRRQFFQAWEKFPHFPVFFLADIPNVFTNMYISKVLQIFYLSLSNINNVKCGQCQMSKSHNVEICTDLTRSPQINQDLMITSKCESNCHNTKCHVYLAHRLSTDFQYFFWYHTYHRRSVEYALQKL